MSRPARPDEISVIEAAYRISGTETEWLEGLARAAAPLLDVGLGVVAVANQYRQGRVQLRNATTVSGSSEIGDAFQGFMRHAKPDLLGRAFRSSSCEMFSAAVGGLHELEREPAANLMFSLGVRDAFRVVGVDGCDQVSIAAWLPRSLNPTRRAVARWRRVAEHLGAGFRLRRGLARGHPSGCRPDPFLGSEAIFTSAGTLAHAEGPARAAQGTIARALLGMDRARGRLRSDDPDAALAAWSGLVDGRWSLLEHFDSDGKRFLVARRNDGGPVPGRGLTPRERRVLSARARGLSLKRIGYDEGLSVATISRALQSAMTKLGVTSDIDLPALFPGG